MSDDSRPFGIFRAVVHLALGSVLLGIDQLQEIARESEPLFDSLDENEVEARICNFTGNWRPFCFG